MVGEKGFFRRKLSADDRAEQVMKSGNHDGSRMSRDPLLDEYIKQSERSFAEGSYEDLEHAKETLLFLEESRAGMEVVIEKKSGRLGRRILGAWRWLGDKNCTGFGRSGSG